MKLVKCHITGFGRLCDFKYDFDPKVNNIFEENGWGKTTFSAFIKAMFYGLKYSPKLKSKFLDREHYNPWNRGIFGGNLVFKTDKGIFRVERTFGKRDKDDTFKLFDDKTGRESDAYTNNLGEELFGVDEESFEKTVFIGQEDLETKITDKINAMVGDLSQTKGDMDVFERAVAKIGEAKKIYKNSSKKNPGKIDDLQEKIKQLEKSKEEIEPKKEAYSKQQEIVNEDKTKLKELRAEKENLREQIQKCSKAAEKNGIFQTQNELLNKKKETLEKINQFFKDKEIKESDISNAEDLIQKIIVDKRSIDAKKNDLPKKEDIERVNRLFEENKPEEEKLSEWKSEAEKLQELRAKKESLKLSGEDEQELKELKEFFGNFKPTQDDILSELNNGGKVFELKGRKNIVEDSLEKEFSQLDKLNSDSSQKMNTLFVCFITLFLMVAAFIFFNIFKSILTNILGYFSIVLAFIFLAGYFFRRNILRKKKRREAEYIEEKIEELKEQLTSIDNEIAGIETKTENFLGQYNFTEDKGNTEKLNDLQKKLDRFESLEKMDSNFKKNKDIEEISNLELKLHTEMGYYATFYGVDLIREMKEMYVIKRLSEDLELKKKIDTSKGNLELLNHRVEESNRDIETFISKFDFNEYEQGEDDNSNESVQKKKVAVVRKNYEDSKNIKKEIEELKKDIDKLKPEIMPDIATDDIDKMQNRDRELDQIIEELHKKYIEDANRVSELSEELSVLEDEQNKEGDLREEKEKYERKFELLKQTESLLQKAKRAFMEEYMSPIHKKMESYVDSIYPEKKNELSNISFEINMDLKVTINYKGYTMKLDYLSNGFKDMLALCVRFALIDIMYKEEHPIIIMDDPFTAFDKDKVKEGVKLIKKLSENRQIIYFTCHKSREISVSE